MQIEIEVKVTTGKYGKTIAETHLTMDADEVNAEALSIMVNGMVNSAAKKANEYVEPPKGEEKEKLPTLHPQTSDTF